MSQAQNHLLCKHEALISNPRPTKKKKEAEISEIAGQKSIQIINDTKS
jgi:hypothetical protein